MSSGWSSRRGRLLSRVGLGVLDWFITPDAADGAVGDALAREMRVRALPSRLAVQFVLGLCLFSGKSYGQVMRKLVSGLDTALAAAGWAGPATTALTGGRRRAGEKALESLFGRLCSALSPGKSPWSHVCGLLAVAWDGTTVTAAASPANIAAFGRARRKKGGYCHYPQIRLVSLVACGTRCLLGAAMGPLTGKGSGERALAAGLLGCLRTGMLLIADRGFYSWALWRAAAATGAALLWRIPAAVRVSIICRLPDGSCLAAIADPDEIARRTRRNGQRRRRGSTLPPDTSPVPVMRVRVIEFSIRITDDQGRARTEQYRVITTLLDWRRYPAGQLAAAYGWRWAIETGYREFKTYLRGPGKILRSRTPDLARQELWAYLCIYQAIRAVICRAAARGGLDPDKISFTLALDTIRETVGTPASLDTALAGTEDILLHPASLVPARPGRVWTRAVTRPVRPYPSRGNAAGPISHTTTCTITVTTPSTTTRTPASQPQHHQTTANQPP